MWFLDIIVCLIYFLFWSNVNHLIKYNKHYIIYFCFSYTIGPDWSTVLNSYWSYSVGNTAKRRENDFSVFSLLMFEPLRQPSD